MLEPRTDQPGRVDAVFVMFNGRATTGDRSVFYVTLKNKMPPYVSLWRGRMG